MFKRLKANLEYVDLTINFMKKLRETCLKRVMLFELSFNIFKA